METSGLFRDIRALIPWPRNRAGPETQETAAWKRHGLSGLGVGAGVRALLRARRPPLPTHASRAQALHRPERGEGGGM